MSWKHVWCGAALATLAVSALAENVITVWYCEPNDPNAYEINQVWRTLVVKAPGTFKVQATGDDPKIGRAHV